MIIRYQDHIILTSPGEIEQIPGKIEQAARTCYKTENRTGCKAAIPNNCLWWKEDSDCKTMCEHHSSSKMVQNLMRRKHMAMLEFGDLTVKFITNRSVTHELVRHRICSYAQESQRYVRYDNVEFILPVWCSDNLLGEWPKNKVPSYEKAEATFFFALMEAEKNYQNLLEMGWAPEQAREVLPNAVKTEIVVKANIREWIHIFQLRCSPKAHPQIRSLMANLLVDLQENYLPIIFGNPEEN